MDRIEARYKEAGSTRVLQTARQGALRGASSGRVGSDLGRGTPQGPGWRKGRALLSPARKPLWAWPHIHTHNVPLPSSAPFFVLVLFPKPYNVMLG